MARKTKRKGKTMAKPPTGPECYLLIGWQPGGQQETRGPFATVAGAQAAWVTMNANPNGVIVGPLPVAVVIQGALNP